MWKTNTPERCRIHVRRVASAGVCDKQKAHENKNTFLAVQYSERGGSVVWCLGFRSACTLGILHWPYEGMHAVADKIRSRYNNLAFCHLRVLLRVDLSSRVFTAAGPGLLLISRLTRRCGMWVAVYLRAPQLPISRDQPVLCLRSINSRTTLGSEIMETSPYARPTKLQ